MPPLNVWEILLLAVAAYIAVTSLVRLMRQRRDEMVASVQQQIDRQKEISKRAEKKASDSQEAA